MGLFDFLNAKNLKAVADVLEDAVTNAVEQVTESVENQTRQNNTNAGNASAKGASSTAGKKSLPASGEKVLRTRLEKIIAEQWDGYELRKDVAAAEMQAEEGAMDYSYGLYQNGVPKAMFMINTNRTMYNSRRVVLAQKACNDMRVPYMNFMSHLPNTEEYISQRLKKMIV
ncbi:MAG: hypothetical protein IJZ00_04935 [Lachnospiraceae bacterium]|nr:hypothetical protein [Lachnospiraceae bacterium]MBQ8261611.1 hypothetical protein [Lachnospiraceae bacterium]